MAYKSDIIAATIGRLNVQYFLPAIQREFVWHPDQIVRLFDSVMRGYPISSFLFWELKPENKDRWDIYKFVERFDQRSTHNELAAAHGVHQLTLVLDGQQRLTSLLIGLKGSYTVKKPKMFYANPKAWVEQHLFLDLLKDPKADDEDMDGDLRYGFRFLGEAPQNNESHYWLKVGRILDFDSEDRFDEFREHEWTKVDDSTPKGLEKVFNRTLDRLYRTIWKDEAIAHHTEHDQDYDRVLDIFVRANEGGTKLSKSDLLLSMVTAQWAGINAREEIYAFVDRLNSDLARKNDFDKDFIMKSCLFLTDLPVQYKVDNFTRENIGLIQSKWQEIKSAIERGIDLVNLFGIDRDTLTSANAIIPVIYYLYTHPDTTLRGTTPFDVRNGRLVRRWLTMALLNNVFGGASDTVLAAVRRVLQEQPKGQHDFPAARIIAGTARLGRPSQFDEYAIDNYLSTTYGKQTAFLALSLLYERTSLGAVAYHVDHIFPQALFTDEKLRAQGIAPDRWGRYRERMNRIVNLELLTAQENEEKADQAPEKWLATRDVSLRQRHLIPQSDAILQFDKFEEFLEARERLIRERLNQLFSAGAHEQEQAFQPAV